ncbi:hypothetical protein YASMINEVIRUS_974 [Yasminevirus sp. GU-2018]|uniref:Uncharacterized protein n=1 Tax=Yasminevirus sp. GU-2018 TaxID=2420051 RepID=A0A5K0UA83_9VIRU|nr:hypothetical protein YASMINEVIRUS_974 [Yasminevirus sp. GU-2018]
MNLDILPTFFSSITIGVSLSLIASIGLACWNVLIPTLIKFLFGEPWVYDCNSGNLNHGFSHRYDNFGHSGRVHDIRPLNDRISVFSSNKADGGFSDTAKIIGSIDKDTNKGPLTNPQIPNQRGSHGTKSGVSFGSFLDFNKKFYFIRTYDHETKLMAFFVLWRSPDRAVMTRFIENYRISNNRNYLSSRISPSKFLLYNTFDTLNLTSHSKCVRFGRVDNINSRNIVGTQHQDILKIVNEMYSGVENHSSAGMTLKRVFLLSNACDSGSSVDDIIDTVSNETGLDIYSVKLSLANQTVSEFSNQDVDLSGFYPRDDAVSVYRFDDIEHFVLVNKAISKMLNKPIKNDSEIGHHNVVDKLLACNPSNSIVFLVCDSDDKTICDEFKQNNSIDLVVELKDELMFYSRTSSSPMYENFKRSPFSLVKSPPTQFELQTADTVLQFLDIYVGDLDTYFKNNRDRYSRFIDAHSQSYSIRTPDKQYQFQKYSPTDVEINRKDKREMIVQLIRGWIVNGEVKTCRDIVNKCRYISIDVHNRLFEKLK